MLDMGRVAITYGLATQNAKRYPVLNQLMALSETWKYSAAVVEIDEKVSHYIHACTVSTWLTPSLNA